MARITLRIPDSLHDDLRDEAGRQGVSLNTALVAAAARWLAGVKASAWLQEERSQDAVRAARAILARHARAARAAGSVMTEEEAGELAADLVRKYRRGKI